MRNIWISKMRIMNGTVTMRTVVTAFTSKELVEEAQAAVRRKNAATDPMYSIIFDDIESILLYEIREEVPILNDED